MTTLTALSLGAGVQSTTIALLAINGVIPKPDHAIFADTGWEPAAVYTQVDRIATALQAAGVTFHRVTNGNLRVDTVTPDRRYAALPFYLRNPDGTDGMGRRQCTSEYKLAPIKRKLRELLGAKAPHYRRVPKGRIAEQWVGFSTDEFQRANKVKDNQGVQYLTTTYPLLDLGWSRLDRAGWGNTVKSACIGCPYHGNRAWRDLRDNHPDEWADAIAFDEQIRADTHTRNLLGTPYLHRSRLPLSIAPIDHVTRTEAAENYAAGQPSLLTLLEDGDPDGCSPYGCRTGALA
jgi:hypothetical protein